MLLRCCGAAAGAATEREKTPLSSVYALLRAIAALKDCLAPAFAEMVMRWILIGLLSLVNTLGLPFNLG